MDCASVSLFGKSSMNIGDVAILITPPHSVMETTRSGFAIRNCCVMNRDMLTLQGPGFNGVERVGVPTYWYGWPRGCSDNLKREPRGPDPGRSSPRSWPHLVGSQRWWPLPAWSMHCCPQPDKKTPSIICLLLPCSTFLVVRREIRDIRKEDVLIRWTLWMKKSS